jgi:hypothetical protein
VPETLFLGYVMTAVFMDFIKISAVRYPSRSFLRLCTLEMCDLCFAVCCTCTTQETPERDFGLKSIYVKEPR